MVWYSTALSFLGRYATPLKYISSILAISLALYYVYDIYTDYQKLIKKVQAQAKEIDRKDAVVLKFQAIAKQNATLYKKSNIRHQKTLQELKKMHEKAKKREVVYVQIKEKTYHEPDAPIAPVLRNAITRLQQQRATSNHRDRKNSRGQ